MNVAAEFAAPPPRRRTYHRAKPRRSHQVTVTSVAHQKMILELLQERLERERVRWRRTSLQRMIRSFHAALQVNQRKEHLRRIRSQQSPKR